MNIEEFEKIKSQIIQKINETISHKRDEYATEHDVLSAFKCAAQLLDTTQQQALFGMLVKHLVSISEMCKSNIDYDLSTWDEKIIDSINYLILLRCIVYESINNKK
jgi:hypothetical protein